MFSIPIMRLVITKLGKKLNYSLVMSIVTFSLMWKIICKVTQANCITLMKPRWKMTDHTCNFSSVTLQLSITGNIQVYFKKNVTLCNIISKTVNAFQTNVYIWCIKHHNNYMITCIFNINVHNAFTIVEIFFLQFHIT